VAFVAPDFHPRITHYYTHLGTVALHICAKCTLDVRKYSFAYRVIDIWNSLSSDIVSACSISVFKHKLEFVDLPLCACGVCIYRIVSHCSLIFFCWTCDGQCLLGPVCPDFCLNTRKLIWIWIWCVLSEMKSQQKNQREETTWNVHVVPFTKSEPTCLAYRCYNKHIWLIGNPCKST